LTAIDEESELKSLRKKIEDAGKPKKEKQATPLPYHEFEFKGFKILVGRNAEANDLLTFKHSFKDDLWLHAKDVAGSHVLVKYQSGKSFPKDVIERAGELAAYNSKRKTDSLCPVVFTPKKFVRKRKGDPAGTVVVEKESVMIVVPRL
jgi:predicted ribosome quality control (RQC) complex YloA/Tae2 family protein